MKYAYAGLAFAAAASAQGVATPLYPQGVNGPPTQGTNFPNNAFVLGTTPTANPEDSSQVYNCDDPSYSGAPRISLTGSALTDERGSTGSIVANDQFQFDGPPQAGVKVSAGWVRQDNGRLSIGGNDKFYNCLSGGFSNIYSATQGLQCKQVYLTLQTCTYCTKGNVTYKTVKKDNTPQFQIPQASNNDNIADDPSPGAAKLGSTVGASYKDGTCPNVTSSSVMPSSTAAPSSMAASSMAVSSMASSAVASSAAPSTTAAPPMSMPAPPMAMLPPQTQAAVSAPAANTTMSTAAATPKTTTTSPASSPSPFTNGAPAIAIGQKAIALLAVVAGAFALA